MTQKQIKKAAKLKADKDFFQTFILIPYLVSMVLVGYLVFAFLSNANGFINKGILEKLGKEGISWYTKPEYWPFILTIVNLWKGFGFQSIVCGARQHGRRPAGFHHDGQGR